MVPVSGGTGEPLGGAWQRALAASPVRSAVGSPRARPHSPGKLASALAAGMNPYPHHPSLAGSPHHPPGEPHHGYGSSTSGNGTATTPDPSPHSPPYGAGPQDGPQGYPSHQQAQGMPSNGHHHAAAQAMMQQAQDQPHHRPYQHPHLPGHMAGYPPVNHNNNCTLKVSRPRPEGRRAPRSRSPAPR